MHSRQVSVTQTGALAPLSNAAYQAILRVASKVFSQSITNFTICIVVVLLTRVSSSLTTYPSLLPLTTGAIACGTFYFAILTDSTTRKILSPLLFGNGIISLSTSFKLNAISGLASVWALAVCITLHHAASILFFEPKTLPPTVGTQRWLLTYKIWNSPRRIGIHYQRKPLGTRRLPPTTRLTFALARLLRIAIYWLIQIFLLTPLVLSFIPTHHDFSPTREPFFRRLLFPNFFGPPVTIRETRLRGFVAVYWIWTTIVYLETFHTLFAFLFVYFLRVDEPEEWPRLFGSPLQAYSLRGFWGSFWHRLATPACAASGQWVAGKVFGLRPGGKVGKWFVGFWTFFVSGVVHWTAKGAVEGWDSGGGDIAFFMTNYFAYVVECVVVGRLRRMDEEGRLGVLRSMMRCSGLGKAVGFVWVFGFFFWAVPRWQYPGLYTALDL